MRTYNTLLFTMVLVLALTACGSPEAAQITSSTETVSTPEQPSFSEPEPADETLASEPPEPSRKDFDITLAFAGDINFDDHWCNMAYYHNTCSQLSDVIDEAYLQRMRNADVMWINNEFTYSTRGTPLHGKAYTFRADPGNVKFLDDMGVDIVGLANNHVYDYGREALEDTFETLKGADIPYVGAGYDLEEAMTPVYFDVDGIKIAYVAASRAEKNKMTPQATEDSPGILRCYDNTLFLEEIREADEQADYVIALPHWGTEYSTTLEKAQTEGARAYLEAGADAVIGAHTHCLQGVETINGKPVVYSLGNFWFNEKTLMTMLAELHLTGTIEEKDDGSEEVITLNTELELWPGWQKGYVTRMAADENERAELLAKIEALPPD